MKVPIARKLAVTMGSEIAGAHRYMEPNASFGRSC